MSSWTKSKTDKSPDYRISIDISDLNFMRKIHLLIKSIIETKSVPRSPKPRVNRIPRLYLFVRNKDLYSFFNLDMEIPKGNKSSIVKVPLKIINGTIKIKKHFMAGYFDADGGFRGNSLGFTTASKKLNNGISTLLDELNILHSTDKWINRKYSKEFYGIKLKKKEIDKFLNALPIQNEEKLDRIKSKFQCGDAGVAKRDR